MKETAYLLQAVLICVWWVGLASSRTFFQAFQYEGVPPVAFWSFAVPDLVLIALLSFIRAYRRVLAIEYVILGAFAYATLYCFNATVLTGSGWLPSGIMMMGLAYNLFVCFERSLFRESSTSSMRVNGYKTLVQVICIWAIFLVVIPYVLLDSFKSQLIPDVRSVGVWAGGMFFLAFSFLGLFSAYVLVRNGEGTPLPLDQTNRLVDSGPYRIVRNPMAIAGIGQGIAIATIYNSVAILLYALIGGLVWHLVVRPIEERDMIERFGDAYLDYRRRVRCWIPSFRDIW
jgi:protein-S-isoprenylcysteine O-methyltransferase Ste14